MNETIKLALYWIIGGGIGILVGKTMVSIWKISDSLREIDEKLTKSNSKTKLYE